MFTDTNFISVGKVWTPKDADYEARLEVTRTGRQLYDGEFTKVFNQAYQTIASRYGDSWTDVEQLIIKINLFKSMTETFKILAFAKDPVITDKVNQTILDEITGENFIDLMKRSFISAHAQGTGIFKVRIKDSKPIISSVNPELYIPIYEDGDMDTLLAHVLVYNFDVYIGTDSWSGKPKYEKRLKVEINTKGSVQTQVFKLNDKGDKIKGLISDDKGISYTDTGWDDFLIFTFDYGHPNWREYARSQYDDVVNLVDEIVVRISNNSKILDDHADPQLIVGEKSLVFDNATGKYSYKRKKVLKLNSKDDIKPSYLTWDGSLDASEKQLDRLMGLFYMVSGTNPQMYGEDIAGNLSGDALAKILLIPISKVREMILALEEAAEAALECALTIAGAKSPDVCVEFEIGAFNTLSDISTRLCAEKSAGITSIERAVRELNPEYDDDAVAKEVARIEKEGSVGNLTDLTNNDPNAEDPNAEMDQKQIDAMVKKMTDNKTGEVQ